MNDKFEELAKNMAQSITRRGALKEFGVGLAAIVLASLALANEVAADRKPCLPSGTLHCKNNNQTTPMISYLAAPRHSADFAIDSLMTRTLVG